VNGIPMGRRRSPRSTTRAADPRRQQPPSPARAQLHPSRPTWTSAAPLASIGHPARQHAGLARRRGSVRHLPDWTSVFASFQPA
jgi:hypothetical protein